MLNNPVKRVSGTCPLSIGWWLNKAKVRQKLQNGERYRESLPLFSPLTVDCFREEQSISLFFFTVLVIHTFIERDIQPDYLNPIMGKKLNNCILPCLFLQQPS